MPKIKYLIFITLIMSFVVLFAHVVVLAQDSDAEDIQNKIDKYEKKLNELSGKEKTLSNEIDYLNGQIDLTELRIKDSNSKITKTENEITKLGGSISDIEKRIVKLEGSIEYQKKLLSARLREQYKSRESSPILVIFGNDTVGTILQKIEYLKVMELHDNKVVGEMAKVKGDFNSQRNTLVEEKAKSETLRKQLLTEKANLAAYQNTLESQQTEKKKLLEITQNDENKYQDLLREAQQELNQITGAVSVIKNQKARDVKKGEAIGIQGSTGNSTGDHLHFGVYKYSSFSDIDGWNWYYSNYVNPEKVLKSRKVYWDTGCENAGTRTVGKGDWAWPLSNPQISQGFGYTCWSKRFYNGNPHPAFDMFGPINSTVYAVADGKAYFCRNCLNDGGNGVFIFHKDGYMTLYWHLK